MLTYGYSHGRLLQMKFVVKTDSDSSLRRLVRQNLAFVRSSDDECFPVGTRVIGESLLSTLKSIHVPCRYK